VSGSGEPSWIARLDTGPDGRSRLVSPTIGFWLDPPARGTLVGPGTALGRIARLSRCFDLIAPAEAQGRVLDGVPTRRVVPVGYGDLLLELAPLDAAALAPGFPRSGGGGGEIDAGLCAVVAPSAGVFYSAPSPGGEPYVRVGQTVRLGQPVGLVEVMKTFHQLRYVGPGLPDEARVVEVRARDGAEVRAGEVLFVLR
jgi:biotin carboxyl carrier protein